MANLSQFIEKFWLQGHLDNPERQDSLPLTDLSGYNYYSTSLSTTRQGTIKIYVNETGTPQLIAQDDGSGNLEEVVSSTLNTSTGVNNTVDYTNNEITLTWDPTYLASLTNNPYIVFSVLLEEGPEAHAEMRDLIGEILTTYKDQELDDQVDYYKPESIPSHLIETFAKEHNWTLDRFFSEATSYFRKQLKNLYNIYKHKRRIDGIRFGVNVITKIITTYNMLAKEGNNQTETNTNYNDFSTYARFDMQALLDLTDSNPSGVEDVFENLYASTSEYYPTKHFLLDLALQEINSEGSLLREEDIQTLRFYTLAIKSKTQYPHFSATLGIDSDYTETQQDGSLFDFLLSPEEALFYINSYKSIYAGPNSVYSIAITGTGAWALFPLLMNQGYQMNQGLVFNMGPEDYENYVTSFQLGTGSHSILTSSLTALDNTFYTGTDIEFNSDSTYAYFTCNVPLASANTTLITEFGLFNSVGELVFYAKFPSIYKKNTHTLQFKVKIKATT